MFTIVVENFENLDILIVRHAIIFFLCSSAGDENDIIDESMGYFKANVFFKSYEVKVCMCM